VSGGSPPSEVAAAVLRVLGVLGVHVRSAGRTRARAGSRTSSSTSSAPPRPCTRPTWIDGGPVRASQWSMNGHRTAS